MCLVPGINSDERLHQAPGIRLYSSTTLFSCPDICDTSKTSLITRDHVKTQNGKILHDDSQVPGAWYAPLSLLLSCGFCINPNLTFSCSQVVPGIECVTGNVNRQSHALI